MIAQNQFERLNGLVYDGSINIIKDNFSKLTSEQKNSIAIAKNDIRFCLPYYFNISNQNGRRFAELSTLIYYVPESGELLKQAQFDAKLGLELNQRIILEMYKRVRNDFIIADYRYLFENLTYFKMATLLFKKW